VGDVVLFVRRILVLVDEDDRMPPSQAFGDGWRVMEQLGGEALDLVEARVSAMDRVGHDRLLQAEVWRVPLYDLERKRVDGLHSRSGAGGREAALEHPSCGVGVREKQDFLAGCERCAERDGGGDRLVGLATPGSRLNDDDRFVAEDAAAGLLKRLAR